MNIMKKILFTLSLALIGFAAQAQQWSVGPTVGVSNSWMTNVDDVQAKPGINAGVILNYSNFEHLGLGLGVRYSREGVRYEQGGQELVTTLDYIRIPLKFYIYLNDMEDDFRPKLYIGPQVGFLVNGNVDVPVPSEGGIREVSARDIYKNNDLGILMGTGFNYRVAEATWLNFDINYAHGLTNVADNVDSKNRNVGINLGVAWGF